MSTAARFKYIQPFPFCLEEAPSTTGAYASYKNVTLAHAMDFFWNLEAISFEIYLAGALQRTYTLGPVESLPSPVSVWGGGYYGTEYKTSLPRNPATAPRSRICYEDSTITTSYILTRTAIVLGIAMDANDEFSIRFSIFSNPDPDFPIRIVYGLEIRANNTLAITTGSASFPTGFPPSSGSISILGQNYDYFAGSITGSGASRSWTGTAASLVCNATPFTY